MILVEIVSRCVELSDFMRIFASDKPKEVMGIKRNETAKPQWNDLDYAENSKYDIFSRECWNKTVEWKVLLEHAKRTEGICHLMFENTYPSRLFFAYIELLEANLDVFGDLFYWLTGFNANPLDYGLHHEALSRIFFWNMRCYKDLRQICDELETIESLFMECLKQEHLWDYLKEDPMWKSGDWLSHIRERMDAPITWIEEKRFARHRAFTYVKDIYIDPIVDEIDLRQKIVKIFQATEFFIYIIGACGDFYCYDFASLLSSFRKSEKTRSRYIKPWERYYNDTRDSLIDRMRNNPDLAPWVDKYIWIEKEEYVIGRIFCEESADGLSFPLKKEMEEDFYNPDNWLNILTIAAVLLEYDEQHGVSTPIIMKPLKIGKEVLLTRLSVFIPDETVAKRFVEAAQTMNDIQVVALLKHYEKYGQCLNTKKALWELLHEAGLYLAKYSNWSAKT